MTCDSDGNGTIDESEQTSFASSELYLTFQSKGRLLFQEENDSYPSSYELNGQQLTIYLNFFPEIPGTIKTLDDHQLILDYNNDGMPMEYGFKR